MSKLSKQQQRRIRANRDDKLKHSAAGSAALVVAHLGYGLIVEDQGTLIACDWRKQLGAVAVNDRVLISRNADGSGIVEAVFPRGKTLYKTRGRHTKAVASHLERLLIVIAVEPAWQSDLIDRYLIAARESGIETAILCNKIDLADPDTEYTLRQRLEPYRRLGIPLFFASLEQNRNLEPLTDWLRERQTLLCGQSGVGKSSLIRRLIPAADIWIQSLSAATGLGRHTTTNLRRYPWDGGCLIDSPGVRGLTLTHLHRDAILAGFPDISPYTARCKFNDCRHQNEPGCSVRPALLDGSINRERYRSLQQLLSEHDQGQP